MEMKKAIISTVLISLLTLSNTTYVAATERNQIPKKYQWDLSQIYKNDSELQKDITKIKDEYLPQLVKFKGNINNSKSLLDCLKVTGKVDITVTKVDSYVRLKVKEDSSNLAYSILYKEVLQLLTEFSNDTAFISKEVFNLGKANLTKYTLLPEFNPYKNYLLGIINSKEEDLSEDKQKEITQLSISNANVANDYNNLTSQMKFSKGSYGDIKNIVVDGDIYQYELKNPDRNIRKNAYLTYWGNYYKNKDEFAKLLENNIKNTYAIAQKLGYKTSLEYIMAKNQIPVSVYDNLINSVDNNLEPLHKLVSLRKKVLKIDKVHMYDIDIPIVHAYSIKNATPEESEEIICQVLYPLGNDYISKLKNAFKNRWIDFYYTPNKTSEQYTESIYGNHPYISLNNNYGDYINVNTLIHELGHAINYVYIGNSQNYYNYNQSLLMDEIMSTTNEDILNNYFGELSFYNYGKLGQLDYELNAMISYEILKEKYDKDKSFSIEEYTKNSIGIYKDEMIKLKLLISKPMSYIVSEKIWVENQKIQWNEDESIIFEAELQGKTEIISWILSMGSAVKVLEPVELKEEILKKLEDTIKLYKEISNTDNIVPHSHL
jgi:oligoendopeptidase F